MTIPESTNQSPIWPPTLKLVVGISLFFVIGGLLVQFRMIIGPLMLAIVLTYLFYPIVNELHSRLHLPWRGAVSLLYLVAILILLGLLIWSGVALFQQLQNLVVFLDHSLRNLPPLVNEYANQVIHFGPFSIDLSQLDLLALSNQLMSTAQSMLGQIGGLVGALAGSVLRLVGWLFFILLISYFMLTESGGIPQMFHFELPGYTADLSRLGQELGRIWNAFLRGQLMIALFTMIPYFIMMTILGLRFATSVVLLVGIARFVPYLGPLVTYITMLVIALSQGSTTFGLSTFAYAGVVLLAGVLIDQVIDNLIAPRVMGDVLGVHPAAILIAAIVAAKLLGVIGLLLAAPVLASFQLVSGFSLRKILDLDPWPDKINRKKPFRSFGSGGWLRKLIKRAQLIWVTRAKNGE